MFNTRRTSDEDAIFGDFAGIGAGWLWHHWAALDQPGSLRLGQGKDRGQKPGRRILLAGTGQKLPGQRPRRSGDQEAAVEITGQVSPRGANQPS